MDEEQKFETFTHGGWPGNAPMYRWSDHDRWITRDGPVSRDRKIVGRIFGDAQCWAYQIARRPFDYPQVAGFKSSRDAFDHAVARLEELRLSTNI
jgi:hypothetical protein